MSGTRRKGLVIQQRDRHLLKELDTMRVIDRQQAQVVAPYGSTTRANARLLALTRSGYLKRTFLGTVNTGLKAIYGLSATGAALVDARPSGLPIRPGLNLSGNSHLQHQLEINWVYLAVKYCAIPVQETRFRRWISFRERMTPSVALTPDGYFELEQAAVIRAMFLEIDLGTEAPKLWHQKAQSYLQFAISGQFEKLFSRSQFRVLVVTTSGRHLENIRAAVARLTDKIFWFSTFEQINRDRLWAPVWLRPKGSDFQSLL